MNTKTRKGRLTRPSAIVQAKRLRPTTVIRRPFMKRRANAKPFITAVDLRLRRI